MKKSIALILAIAFCFFVFAPVVCAEGETLLDETDEGDTKNVLDDGELFFSCLLGKDGKSIEIHVDFKHDTLTRYKDHVIEIRRFDAGIDYNEAVNKGEYTVMADLPIALNFSVTLSVEKTVEMFSQYAVVICSPDGEAILGAEPRYPYAESTFKFDRYHKTEFKGMVSAGDEINSVMRDTGCGRVIIPVYFDRMISSSSRGYMYAHEGGYLYFDTTYIDDLEKEIISFSSSGTQVYLQLLPSDGAYGVRSVPNAYNAEVMSSVSACVRFLSKRYDSYENGVVSGFIAGRSIDEADPLGKIFDEYAKEYAFYLILVAGSARIENDKIDVVIPFGSFDSYGISVEDRDDGYRPDQLILSISDHLGKMFHEDFNCNMLMESEDIPVKISEEDGRKLQICDATEGKVSFASTERYDDYLFELNRVFGSAPESFIFLWNIPKDMPSALVSASYAVGYIGLLNSDRASSLTISLKNREISDIEGMRLLIKYIDTSSSGSRLAPVLEMFGAASWNELVGASIGSDEIFRHYYNGKVTEIPTKKGVYQYLNVTSGKPDGWRDGAYGNGVKVYEDSDGERGLRQTIVSPSGSAHSEMTYLYSYNENYLYTPTVAFDLKITDETEEKNLYEIVITVGNEKSSVSNTYTVWSGEANELLLNVKDFCGEENNTKYIKISTRSITASRERYNLWLYGVSGISEIYTDDELDVLVRVERNALDDETKNENTRMQIIYTVVFIILLLAIVIGGVLFTIIHRDDTIKREKKRAETKED